MALSGNKILDTLLNSFSVEELEELLRKKKNAGKPKPQTKREKLKEYYTKELYKLGIYAPNK